MLSAFVAMLGPRSSAHMYLKLQETLGQLEPEERVVHSPFTYHTFVPRVAGASPS